MHMEDRFSGGNSTDRDLIKPTMTPEDWSRVALNDQILLMHTADRWLNQPFAAELLQTVAEKEPLLVFQQYEEIQRQVPEAEHILQHAAERGAEIDPGIIFFYFPLFQDMPYASEVLTTAADKCIQMGRTSALEFAQNYLKHPDAEVVLSRAAGGFPTQAIYFYHNYQTHPKAPNILRGAVGLDPRGAMVHANKYAEAPGAKTLLAEVVAKDPEGARIYRDRYADFLE